jgi:CelD/BcsL family acetyltransferase involved in cellulose biosynthesis
MELTRDLRQRDPAMYNAWLRLFDEDPRGYALQHPDWVLEESPPEGGALVAEWETKERLVGLAVLVPKTIATRRFSGPGPSFTLRGLRLAGNRFLQAKEDTAQLERLLGQVLVEVARRELDFLVIEDLERGIPLERACQDKARSGWHIFVPGGVQARLRIELPQTADEYWKKFSGKTRSTFRRKLKKFGDNRLVKITKPEEVAGFLEHAEAISRQTWQTRHLGLRVRNSMEERIRFEAAARIGLLRSYLWFVNGEPVAFLVGNQAHGIFNYEEVGYATSFAKNSPGQMMLLQVLDELFTVDRPHLFDFGGGDAPYKRMFGNQERESATMWVLPPGLRRTLLLGYLRAYSAIKSEARRVIADSPLATKLRQRVRYGGADKDKKETAPAENDVAET